MSVKNSKQNSRQISCEYYVEGMHCAACELYVEDKISQLKGIKNVNAVLKSGKLHINADREISAEELTQAVEENGYKIVLEKSKYASKINWIEIGKAFLIAGTIMLIFVLLQKLDIVSMTSQNGAITLPFVFIIGVIASLSTCMAVVGGLVLTLSSHYSMNGQTKPLILFHVSRIVGFFILGGIIGLIGSAFALNGTTTFIINLVLFFVMLILAINMLGVLPQAAKMQLKMPKSFGKNIMSLSKTSSMFMPLILGAATFFLPCGFTQSMQLYALTTGHFLSGALTMFIFALGTFPMLALVSFLSNKFSKSVQSGLFYKTAGFLIIFFAIFNLINSLVGIGIYL